MADTSAASLTSYTENQPNVDNYYVNPQDYEAGVGLRFFDWFTGRNRAAEYEAMQNKKYLQYENDYNLWLDSTKYQRAVEDLKKAGLNPWLAVQSGLTGGSTANQSGSTSAAKLRNSKGDEKAVTGFKDFMVSALKLGLTLKLLGL